MMGLMWYLMGMATTGAIWGYASLRRRYRLGSGANLALLGTFVLAWLCVGWSWGSFAEGEPQSGAMGLICFGLSTLVVAALSWRHLIQPGKRS
ncbi:tetrachloroethene dehalogenase [Ferrimonas sp.]|uniref:tetrachloroethene dehalogenase n=1 Tax=Ferrimonas sp. TaxID=2080861 RepID=UPI003A92E282